MPGSASLSNRFILLEAENDGKFFLTRTRWKSSWIRHTSVSARRLCLGSTHERVSAWLFVHASRVL